MRIVIAELDLLEAAVEGDDALGRALGCVVRADWAGFPEAVPAIRDVVAADPPSARWWSRFFLVDGELVGWGGFKGPPADGVVEVGYSIAPERQGRGLATAAVRELLREAYEEPGVRAVIAHTLPERNASVRVLEKAGFVHDGVIADDEGTVWRHRHEPATPPAARP